jgi:hypothetical protein
MNPERSPIEPLDKDLVAEGKSLKQEAQEEIGHIWEDLRGGDQDASLQRYADFKQRIETIKEDSLSKAADAEGVERDNLLARVTEADYVLELIKPLEKEVAGK